MESIEELRRQLEEERRGREEEQRGREAAESLARQNERQREEEQRRREEEQRRREEAEHLTIASRPQTLQEYFETCHSLDLSAQVVTDRSLTTQGETADPVGRIFPRRIVPWDDFATRQEEIWDALSTSDSFFSNTAFPSQHQMEYVQSLLRPITSEIGLRDFERDVVENAVEKLIQSASTDAILQRQLGIRGTVTFESHTNLGADQDTISKSMEQMSLGIGEAPSAAASTPKPRVASRRRKARGKGNRADQFCIYRMSDGEKMLKLAIEYKAPHKLSVDEVVTGLESAIEPEPSLARS